MDYLVKHLGQHRGNARLWFETQALEKVGLSRGTRYNVEWVAQPEGDAKNLGKGVTQQTETLHLVFKPDPDGKRVVSGKTKGGGDIPIIDINDSKVLGFLADQPAVKAVFDAEKKQLVVSKLSSVEMQHARKNRLARGLLTALTVAALCFGGGVMDHAAHAGMADAGIKSELVAAVEINADLLEHARLHNPVVRPTTKLYATPMQELVQDAGAMANFPKADVLVTGIPCSGASISGKSKLGLATAEDHPEVGHLVVPYLMMVNAIQPSVAVVECVVPYSKTVSAKLMRQMFRDMGYTVQEVVLNSWDFGSIEARDRWYLVAATQGLEIDLANMQPVIKTRPKLAQFLQPNLLKHDWREMEGRKAKEERDIADGKGFKMQIVTPDSERIGTIGKDYNKNRSTEPKVQHPTQPSLLRLLTPVEHAAIKGFPVDALGGLSVTAAHQLLGQSVDVRPVRALFERIGDGMTDWIKRKPSREQRALGYSLERATG